MPEQPRVLGQPPQPKDTRPYDNEIEGFENYVINHMESARRRAEELRDKENWRKRLALWQIRSQAKADVTYGRQKEVDRSSPDGFNVLAMNQGWAARNAFAASAQLHAMLFGNGRPFVIFSGRGAKDENKWLIKIQSAIARYFLLKSRFWTKAALEISFQIPHYGTSFLRAQIAQTSRLVRLSNGKFQEIIAGDEVEEKAGMMSGSPFFATKRAKRWRTLSWDIGSPDIQDVLVTDYSRRSARDQQGVWISTPNLTVSDLAPGEMLEEPLAVRDQDGNFVEWTTQRVGRWRNFGKLRDAAYQKAPLDASSSTSLTDRAAVEMLPRFSLIEYEGMFDWHSAMRAGVFNERLFYYMDMHKFMDIPQFASESDFKDEMARRLSQIPVWNIGYTGGESPNSPHEKIGRILLEFKPSSMHDPRNTMHNLQCFPDRTKFLGLSIAERGEKLEKAGDEMQSDIVWAHRFNAHPPGIINETLLDEPDRLDDLHRLDKWQRGRADPRLILMARKLEIDPNAPQKIAALERNFDLLTGQTPLSKGMADAKTATQEQLNQANTTALMRMIAVPANMILADMVRHLMHETFHRLGPDGYRELAVEVAGLHAASIDKVMDELKEGEWDCLPVLASSDDPTVQATIIERTGQVFRDVLPPESRLAMARRTLDVSNIPHPEELIPSELDVLNPEEEHEAMRHGNHVDVNPRDPHRRHIPAHYARLEELRRDKSTPLNERELEIRGILKQLPLHEAYLAQEEAQNQAAQSAPGAAAPQRAPLQTTTSPASSQGLSQNVTERAGGGRR